VPRLLAGVDLPFASEGFSDFRVGNRPTGVRIRKSLLDRPNDVEVVEDVVEIAVIR
jgi:hypothetical protein